VSAQLFDVRCPEKNPKKTGNEGRPGSDKRTLRGGHQWRKSTRMAPCAEKTNKLQYHDQRARRCFSKSKSVQHLTRVQPAKMFNRLLRYIRQHCVSAAKSDHRRFTEENSFFE